MIQEIKMREKKMHIGYARVSTGLQNLDLQKDSLKEYNSEKIFNEHM